MRHLLHIKHWKLFLAIVAAPLLAVAYADKEESTLVGYANLIGGAVYFLWLFAIGRQQKSGVVRDVTYLFCIVTAFFIAAAAEVVRTFGVIDHVTLAGLDFWVDKFFAIFWFLAVILTTIRLRLVETRHNLRHGTFLGDFMLLLIFPFGVWVIQPRVNSLDEIKAKSVD